MMGLRNDMMEARRTTLVINTRLLKDGTTRYKSLDLMGVSNLLGKKRGLSLYCIVVGAFRCFLVGKALAIVTE